MAITDRTYAFQSYINSGNTSNYLVNSTGIANAGGTDAASIVGGIFNVAATIGMAAMAGNSNISGASGSTSAPTATLSGLATSSQMACSKFESAKGSYETCKNELTALEARKANAENADLPNLADFTSSPAYTEFKALKDSLHSIQTAINTITNTKSALAVQEAMINTNGLSGTGKNLIAGIDLQNATGPCAASKITADKYPQSTENGATGQNQTYLNDLAAAQKIDNAIVQRTTIKTGLLTTYNNLSVPNGITKQPMTESNSADDILSALNTLKTNVQQTINTKGQETITVGEGENAVTKTVADVYAGKATFDQAQGDKGLSGDNTLAKQIERKKSELATKRSAVTACESDLIAARDSLTSALNQIITVETEKSQYEQSERDLSAAKADNKKGRNVFQRMFGRKKNAGAQQALSDAKTTRKTEKGQYENASAQFTGTYADANVGMKNVIAGQLDLVNAKLAEIAAIKAEATT